jgi:hypothetical protein
MHVITKAGEIRLNESLATSCSDMRKVLHSIPIHRKKITQRNSFQFLDNILLVITITKFAVK